MNRAILNTYNQEFINENLTSDLVKLTLKGSPFPEVSIQELIIQIEGKLKAKDKLPFLFNHKAIYYPPKINLEQTSSEATAKYKSELVTGKTLADLTGGFGVDTFYFSKIIKSVNYYETNQHLYEIASHNFLQLGQEINCYNEDGMNAIADKKFDVIYVDPSRRNETKGKVFFLEDSIPDVVSNLKYLLDRCKLLMIKTSPMLDISVGLNSLNHVSQLHIVAVKNEVKELLWILQRDPEAKVKITAVNSKEHSLETFQSYLYHQGDLNYSLPKKYLYEPNAAIMKSGLFEALASEYNIDKLEANSHLFTSDLMIDFPGRRFEICKSIAYTKAEIKKEIIGIKANITTRNFPESVSSLKSKWKIKDGGDKYLFFTTNKEKKKVILKCIKIKP